MTRADRIAQALRVIAPGGKLADEDVPLVNKLAEQWEARSPASPAAPSVPFDPADPITSRVALEIVGHEAIVLEAYKDSVGVWTWGIGVTDKSGHAVRRYKDNPQTIERCLEVYVWLLREKYLPAVLTAFKDFPLTEAQLAAALSFHYNTGAISRASWVGLVKAGKIDEAKVRFMEWRNPPEVIGRRTKERDLFFAGKWSGDGKANVIPVRKPSYQPSFGGMKRVDISADIAAALAAPDQ